MSLAYRRLVVKIGSNVLTQNNGLPDLARMEQLVAQVAGLKAQGLEVIMVSSGAVAAGRSLITLPTKADAVRGRQLLAAVGYVDVLIPRGSQQLVNYVRENARVPVIETGTSIVHTYFDETGNLSKGQAIIHNAKTRRVSVCNALDCLLIHEHRLADLPELLAPLAAAGVELFADAPAFSALAAHYPVALLNPSSAAHYGTEFLALKMAVKTVGSLEQALDHIAQHGSRHSEAIVSENSTHIDTFLRTVDAAAVYANASTAFTDGGQFGLGAEIGISTQKLHARGPMGLQELTSYKWLVRGDGQIRTS